MDKYEICGYNVSIDYYTLTHINNILEKLLQIAFENDNLYVFDRLIDKYDCKCLIGENTFTQYFTNFNKCSSYLLDNYKRNNYRLYIVTCNTLNYVKNIPKKIYASLNIYAIERIYYDFFDNTLKNIPILDMRGYIYGNNIEMPNISSIGVDNKLITTDGKCTMLKFVHVIDRNFIFDGLCGLQFSA